MCVCVTVPCQYDSVAVSDVIFITYIRHTLYTQAASTSDASISLFQFRYDIDTIFTKYHDIDIDIKYISKMHMRFADLNFNGQVFFTVLLMCTLTD